MKAQENNKEVRFFAGNIEVRADEEGKPAKIVGYAAVYGTQSEDIGFRETISKGAFEGADTSDVRALFNHDSSKILGRTKSGTLRVSADEVGLRYEIDVPNTTYAADLLESMQRGDVNQSSFAFSDVDDKWEERDGIWYREIMQIRQLYDVSPVTYPAYSDTSVALRSLDKVKADKAEDVTLTGGENLEKELNLRLRLAKAKQ